MEGKKKAEEKRKEKNKEKKQKNKHKKSKILYFKFLLNKWCRGFSPLFFSSPLSSPFIILPFPSCSSCGGGGVVIGIIGGVCVVGVSVVGVVGVVGVRVRGSVRGSVDDDVVCLFMSVA